MGIRLIIVIPRLVQVFVQKVEICVNLHRLWPAEIFCAPYNIVPEPFGEAINCFFEISAFWAILEEAELNWIVCLDQIIGSHADQPERAWMAKLMEQIDADREQVLSDIRWLIEKALAG